MRFAKVVVFVNDAPPELDSAHKAALRDPRALGDRLGAIMERHPAAIIVLAAVRSLPPAIRRLAAMPCLAR